MAVPLICSVCRRPAIVMVPRQQAQCVGPAQCRVGDHRGHRATKRFLQCNVPTSSGTS